MKMGLNEESLDDRRAKDRGWSVLIEYGSL